MTTKYFVSVSMKSDDLNLRTAYAKTHPDDPPLQLPCKITSEETEISKEAHDRILDIIAGRA